MLTARRLRQLLDYDPKTGVFVWKTDRMRIKAGTIAGSLRPDGRIKIDVDGREYKAHRLAWLHYYGEWPPGLIDHKDGYPANNRIKNLRIATYSQNQANGRVRAKSGFKGTSKTNGKWIAQICKNGERHYLGCFDTPEEACEAYSKAAERIHGEFARIK